MGDVASTDSISAEGAGVTVSGPKVPGTEGAGVTVSENWLLRSPDP